MFKKLWGTFEVKNETFGFPYALECSDRSICTKKIIYRDYKKVDWKIFLLIF